MGDTSSPREDRPLLIYAVHPTSLAYHCIPIPVFATWSTHVFFPPRLSALSSAMNRPLTTVTNKTEHLLVSQCSGITTTLRKRISKQRSFYVQQQQRQQQRTNTVMPPLQRKYKKSNICMYILKSISHTQHFVCLSRFTHTQKRTWNKQKPAASTRMVIRLCVCQPEGSDSPL